MHDDELETPRSLALRFANVALPDDATECDSWEWHEGAWRWFFVSRECQVGLVRVTVGGEQTHEGDVERWLYVSGEDQLSRRSQQVLVQMLEEARAFMDSLS